MNASDATVQTARSESTALTVASFPATHRGTDSAASAIPALSRSEAVLPEAELLSDLRQAGEVDRNTVVDLERRLRSEADPLRLWYLLCCLELAPRDRQNMELRFSALRRLAGADNVTLRFCAYRWLASLHRWNLCYETRAKLAIGKGVNRETGRLQQRLKQLLRTC